MAPLQTKVMRMLSKLRRKAVLITDSRVKLTQEMLNGIKVIKFYGWEDSFSNQLHNLRSKELTYIRSLMILRSVIMGVAVSENWQLFVWVKSDYTDRSKTTFSLDDYSSHSVYSILHYLQLDWTLVGTVFDFFVFNHFQSRPHATHVSSHGYWCFR